MDETQQWISAIESINARNEERDNLLRDLSIKELTASFGMKVCTSNVVYGAEQLENQIERVAVNNDPNHLFRQLVVNGVITAIHEPTYKERAVELIGIWEDKKSYRNTLNRFDDFQIFYDNIRNDPDKSELVSIYAKLDADALRQILEKDLLNIHHFDVMEKLHKYKKGEYLQFMKENDLKEDIENSKNEKKGKFMKILGRIFS